MIIEFLKRNSIILLFLTICLGLLALTLLQLDKQYYQNAKRAIIQDNIGKYIIKAIGETELARLLQLAQDDLREPGSSREEMIRRINGILEGKSIVWRIVYRRTPEGAAKPAADAEGLPDEQVRIDLARYDKLRRNNNFSNSLFLRNFSGIMTRQIDDETIPNQVGHVVFYYTAPLESRQITELTTLYRWYSFFIVTAALLLIFVGARGILYPHRNVVSALEISTPARTAFIHRPHSRLETLYNRMALDAVMARLQDQMRDEIARRPQMTGWEVVQFVSGAFSDQLRPALAACIEMVAEGPGLLRPTGPARLFTREVMRQPEAELLGQLDQFMPRDGRDEAAFALPEGQPPLEGALKLIADPERTGIRYLFAIGLDDRFQDSESVALRPMLERLADLAETGLQTLSLRNQILVQERGRANISLSRNLGHDLTNIIATSKLELMALDRLLGGGQAPEDARRRTILLESLHGLLRSVRFMQETVNLYRSYAFLQHPQLETSDGNDLVSATMELFAMSTSSKVELRRELAEDAPRCFVDPRLIKLALFNIFANALEALRKSNPEGSSYGWIRVSTARAEGGGLCIAVEDSGQGILDGSGQRAESHEIEKIFELGYTSQRAGGGQGEGLGLNWVRQIVQELHGGTIVAENVEGGGARFVITFPPLGSGAGAA